MKRTDIHVTAKRLALIAMSVILLLSLTPLSAIAEVAADAEAAGPQNSLAPARGSQALTGLQDAHTHDGVTFTEWTTTDSLPASPGRYFLSKDVTLTDVWDAPAGSTSLCLNGHTIKQTRNETSVIYVPSGATLDLYDEADNIGKITGGGQGGVMVDGTFTMHGGTICENTAISEGGGVCVNEGEFAMRGGVITKNGAPECGGGVYIGEGAFSASGDIQLSGNTSPNGKDVYLHDGRVINIAGKVSATTPISVATRTAPAIDKPVTITSGLSVKGDVAPDKLFAPESDTFVTSWDAAAKEAVLAVAVTVTFDANGGKGEMAPQKVAAGIPTKLKANSYSREGCDFDRWCTNKSGTSGARYDNKASVAFNANTMLYAQWKRTILQVTFVVDGKTFNISRVPYGSKVSEPPGPKKEGYRFAGWYTSRRTKMGGLIPVAPYDFSSPVTTHDLRLVAVWEEEKLSSVRINDGAPNLKAPNLEDVARATLSKKEIAKGMKLELVVSPLKEEEISRADLQALTALGFRLGVKTGTRFDISIYKTADLQAPVMISKTAIPVELEVEVPQDVLAKSTSEGYDTEFAVLSSHEGEADEHDSTFSDPFCQFRSDHFSTYEIAYKQTPKEEGSPGGSTNKVGGSKKPSSSSAKSTTPKTGDNRLLAFNACLLLLASACALAIARRRA